MAVQTQPHIFNTVPRRDVFGFYDKGNKLKYKEVADTLDFNRKEIAKATRVAVNSVRYEENKIPDKIKDFLIHMAWLLHVTHKYLKDKQKVIQWIESPNPICGGFSPKDMIRMGQYKKLVRIVSSYVEGDTP